ncbi:class I SAM-dependent methyltransferase [bacterium]|nr:class I SAM-dependent methyltransferase [bacterium]
MESREYQTMFELEDRHWWFQSRLLMTEGLLRREIMPRLAGRPIRMLDLGCGTGMFLQRRQAEGDAIGTDIAPEALACCRGRGIGKLIQADAVRIPLADQSVDVVTAFDLIEHVSDDHELIAEVWRVLRPGGFLLATVPAHPLLWSSHDVSLHHKRRYTHHEFRALFTGGRWEKIRFTPCFSFILPVAAAVRLSRNLRHARRPPRSDTFIVPDWINRIMIGLHRFETWWLERANLPPGVSLLTIQRRMG